MSTFNPASYVVQYPVDEDGTIYVHSLSLGNDRQISYDATLSGDGVYTTEEALFDLAEDFYYVWNPAAETDETFDELVDALAHCKEVGPTSFVHWNIPNVCNQDSAEPSLQSLTQVFMWFE